VGCPLPAACRLHAACVQGLGDRLWGLHAWQPGSAERWDYVPRGGAAVCLTRATTTACASTKLVRLPSSAPCAFRRANAARVRSAIRFRSFSASAAIGRQLSPEVKAEGHRRAAEERRSFVSYLEMIGKRLIPERSCKLA
jgi:hypothetical protein